MAKNTTLYIVAYDSPNDRRRTKLHKLLKGFGVWTQYSLFECWLSDAELVKLRTRMDKLLKESEDSVRLYPLCVGCAGKVETIGGPAPKEAMLYLV
jgi:CRISPR-associated protein Cas2